MRIPYEIFNAGKLLRLVGLRFVFSLFQKVQFFPWEKTEKKSALKLIIFYTSTSYVLLPYIPFFYTK